MPEALPMPDPKPRKRPKAVKTKVFCPDCSRPGDRVRMRRKVRWDTAAGKLIEQYCFCPKCKGTFRRFVNVLTDEVTYQEVDEPEKRVFTSRERRRALLEAQKAEDLDIQRG